jgi:hypothetical protein
VLLTLCEEAITLGTVELEAEALPEEITELEAGLLEEAALEGPTGMLEAVDEWVGIRGVLEVLDTVPLGVTTALGDDRTGVLELPTTTLEEDE